jgi:hypothetical protein
VPAVTHNVARAREAMQRIRELTKDVDIGDLTWEDIRMLRDEGRP